MRTRHTLTGAGVQKMVAACKAEAMKNKWNVSIAVVDDAGYLLYLERLDGAGPVTVEVATEKATTAARTRRPTKFWDDRIKERPSFMKFPGLVPLQGGVPITVDGKVVGAIGVSGNTPQEDEDIAKAGAALFK